jgi:4-alpha-glucanotransferase
MRYLYHDQQILGISVPVSALKSKDSLGVGEFLDLISLTDWMREFNFKLIQLLPIHDTGTDPSPYMALSSMALHPIYLRLSAVPWVDVKHPEYQDLKQRLQSHERINYHVVLHEKFFYMHKIYQQHQNDILQDQHLLGWLGSQSWVKSYAVFVHHKQHYDHKAWWQWPEHNQVDESYITEYWLKHYSECMFFVWIQYLLSLQLKQASLYVSSHNIMLKGDIPILMNRDSVDVWQFPHLFYQDRSAGAPPDQYSQLGQSWGFPCYNWVSHENTQFAWWKARIQSFEQYFHAYRIDHVFGFFRIWSIPQDFCSADMGFYQPGISFDSTDFTHLGWNEERIIWVTQPHISYQQVADVFGDDTDQVIEQCFDWCNDEATLRYKPHFNTDKALMVLNYTKERIDELIKWSHDRMFIYFDGQYYLTWFYTHARAYHTLNEHERSLLESLISQKSDQANLLWQDQAHSILKELTVHSDMLPCAEDIGNPPPCLADVLQSLGIMRLHVVRWSRHWEVEGQPWLLPTEYYRDAVASLSIHDSSTLRQWWEEEKDKPGLMKAFDLPSILSQYDELEVEAVLMLIKSFVMQTKSKILVLQLQDILALVESYREDDKQLERINIPGTTGVHNWSYRMKPSIETLQKHMRLTILLNTLQNSLRN